MFFRTGASCPVRARARRCETAGLTFTLATAFSNFGAFLDIVFGSVLAATTLTGLAASFTPVFLTGSITFLVIFTLGAAFFTVTFMEGAAFLAATFDTACFFTILTFEAKDFVAFCTFVTTFFIFGAVFFLLVILFFVPAILSSLILVSGSRFHV